MRRLLLFAVLALAASPSFAQSTRERLESLELRVTQLQETVRGQALIELSQRLDALEAEARSLRGDLDVLQRENDERRKQQADLAGEFDRRIAALEARLAAPAPATAVVVTSEQGAVNAESSPASESAVTAEAPGSGAAAVASTSASAPVGVPPETPEVLYGRAFDALKAANYPAAIAGMSGFVVQFPTHPLADNAQYWLGQSYYVTRDYAKAVEAFAAVGSRSPDTSKAPDALLKKGLSELSLGRNEAARASFNEVIRRYPQNEAARSAREQLGRLR